MLCVCLHDELRAPQERAAQKRRDDVDQAHAALSERARRLVRWEADIIGFNKFMRDGPMHKCLL